MRRGLGLLFAQALAVAATNGSSVSCYEHCDDNVPNRELGQSLRRLDAGSADGADDDAGAIRLVAIDASLDEILTMPCEQICRQIDTRALESCSGPDRAPEEIRFFANLDASLGVSRYSVQCVRVETCASGCVPWGE